MSPRLSIQYTVDALDRIIRVNDSWVAFARENGGSTVLAEHIVGQPLLPQMADESIREIYRMLLARARGGRSLRFTYRCDSPTHRRTFEMTVTPLPNNEVHFASELLREEERPPVLLLDSTQPRGERAIRVCSWCQQVALSDGTWGPVEDVVMHERPLEANVMPKLSHCICDRCSEMMFAKLAQA